MAEIIVKCNECNQLVDADFTANALYVSPCESCDKEIKETEYDKGHDAGYKEGEEAGFQNAKEHYDPQFIDWVDVKEKMLS